MFDKFNPFKKTKTKTTSNEPTDEKAEATKKGKPYIKVLDTNVDNKNPKYGYFELVICNLTN